MTLETLAQKQAEQWHAHEGFEHPSLVGAIIYYSPWVMPGRSAFEL